MMTWLKKRTCFLAESSYYQRVLRTCNKRRVRRSTSIVYLDRAKYGEFHHLYEKLRNCPRGPELFRGYSRMLPETFDYIVNSIAPEIKHGDTNFQHPISTKERLMLTLR